MPDHSAPVLSHTRRVTLLARVRDGLDISDYSDQGRRETLALRREGLIEVFSGPTPRSGYELTPAGEAELVRAGESPTMELL